MSNGNILRVMKEAEAVRDSMKNVAPYDDWIPDEDYDPAELMCDSTKMVSGASTINLFNTFAVILVILNSLL